MSCEHMSLRKGLVRKPRLFGQATPQTRVLKLWSCRSVRLKGLIKILNLRKKISPKKWSKSEKKSGPKSQNGHFWAKKGSNQAFWVRLSTGGQKQQWSATMLSKHHLGSIALPMKKKKKIGDFQPKKLFRNFWRFLAFWVNFVKIDFWPDFDKYQNRRKMSYEGVRGCKMGLLDPKNPKILFSGRSRPYLRPNRPIFMIRYMADPAGNLAGK